MSAASLLALKRQASLLSERERQGLSAYLIKLGQSKEASRKEASRRLDKMEAGHKVSVDALKRQLGLS